MATANELVISQYSLCLLQSSQEAHADQLHDQAECLNPIGCCGTSSFGRIVTWAKRARNRK